MICWSPLFLILLVMIYSLYFSDDLLVPSVPDSLSDDLFSLFQWWSAGPLWLVWFLQWWSISSILVMICWSPLLWTFISFFEALCNSATTSIRSSCCYPTHYGNCDSGSFLPYWWDCWGWIPRHPTSVDVGVGNFWQRICLHLELPSNQRGGKCHCIYCHIYNPTRRCNDGTGISQWTVDMEWANRRLDRLGRSGDISESVSTLP